MKLEVEGRTVAELRANDQRPRVTNIEYRDTQRRLKWRKRD